jgi:pyruvate dehydrogenase E1 component alpha subunit
LPLHERRVKDNFVDLASAHGIPGVSINGNNVLQIYHTAKKMVEKIRHGEGPQFIECRTYRWPGHVGPKDNLEVGLRSKKELDSWKNRCPIKTFENYLLKNKLLSQNELKKMYTTISREVEKAIEFAQTSPYPEAKTLLNHVYN